MSISDLLAVPQSRADELRRIIERASGVRRVLLTTHVNADGDGAGSEAAVATWLEERGVEAAIVNPTPFPAGFRFLLHRPGVVADLGTEAAERALDRHDLALVLDTSEANRIAPLADRLDPQRTEIVDHHPAGPTAVGRTGVQDPTAAATGELVYDLVTLSGARWSLAAVQGVYVALVSDTGSFRFSNTTPRAHAIAAEMLQHGADPEHVFQNLYATFPRRRFDLLREALSSLANEPETGLSWMVVHAAVSNELQSTHEDFEGLIDHARAVQGTRVAVLFREMNDGTTKISFRSNGEADVNSIARRFGGGGHVKAAGASLKAPAAVAVPEVLAAVRAALRGGPDGREL
jgi:phosphoesterase RecJ-like protein